MPKGKYQNLGGNTVTTGCGVLKNHSRTRRDGLYVDNEFQKVVFRAVYYLNNLYFCSPSPTFSKMIFFLQIQWKFLPFPLYFPSYPLYSCFFLNYLINHRIFSAIPTNNSYPPPREKWKIYLVVFVFPFLKFGSLYLTNEISVLVVAPEQQRFWKYTGSWIRIKMKRIRNTAENITNIIHKEQTKPKYVDRDNLGLPGFCFGEGAKKNVSVRAKCTPPRPPHNTKLYTNPDF